MNTPSHRRLDPQPAWVRYEEIAVRLDTGDLVAVACENMADLTGGTAIVATARAVGADGTPRCGADGMPIVATLRHPYRMAELGAGVRLVDIQRDCVRLVLGEPTTILCAGPAGRERRRALSIRTRIGAADAARATPQP